MANLVNIVVKLVNQPTKTEVNGIKTYIKHNMTTTHFIELTIEKINSFFA